MMMINLRRNGDEGSEMTLQKVQENVLNNINQAELQSAQFSSP